MKEIAPGITLDESVSFGKAVIKGTRIHVAVVLGHLAAGMTVEQVAEEYDITCDDVRACLSYASRVIDDALLRPLS